MVSISDFSNYYANLRDGTLELEKMLQTEWGLNYISLIDPIVNSKGQVRVFTDDGKLISQDTVHLTRAGAIFYSEKLRERIHALIKV